ncbi:MAG: Uma2 family endonuclease [Clostridiales bacterium]|jgi:Uma2 family endonuclease|nr:Uma2 family endonuclease [Clostridiales bacterium]
MAEKQQVSSGQEHMIEVMATELIDGVVYDMSAGTPSHASIIGNIYYLLRRYFEGKPCTPFTSELDIHLDEKNRFRPDISVVCDKAKFVAQGYAGVPTLVVEVLSPSTAKIDKGRKFLAYQRFGVKEYWIVNTDSESIEQYVLRDGKLMLEAIHIYLDYSEEVESKNSEMINFSTSFNSSVFEGLAINLTEVFSYEFI